MIYTLDGELHLQDVPTPLLHKLIRELTVPNPKYTNALRLGRPTYNIPETVMLYEIRGNALTLPRGMAEEVWREKPAGTTARDKTLKGEPLTFDTSRFTLRGYQQKAVNAALSCQWHQGVLIAPHPARPRPWSLTLWTKRPRSFWCSTSSAGPCTGK